VLHPAENLEVLFEGTYEDVVAYGPDGMTVGVHLGL